jgi:hypothetical protein
MDREGRKGKEDQHPATEHTRCEYHTMGKDAVESASEMEGTSLCLCQGRGNKDEESRLED